jgi:nitrate reductase NapE component
MSRLENKPEVRWFVLIVLALLLSLGVGTVIGYAFLAATHLYWAIAGIAG